MVLFLLTACEKTAEDTPRAIKKLIKEWVKSEKYLSSVTEYNCGENMIYCFDEIEKVGHCNYVNSHIYNADGDWLCSSYQRLQDNDCIMEYGYCEETRTIWLHYR